MELNIRDVNARIGNRKPIERMFASFRNDRGPLRNPRLRARDPPGFTIPEPQARTKDTNGRLSFSRGIQVSQGAFAGYDD
jgi:hypothetical protein